MKRKLGLLALFLGLAAPLTYYGLLLVGGLDPSPQLSQVLQRAVLATLAAALLSACLAVVALIEGQQRIAATIALGLDLIFLLLFSGLLFALLPH